MANPYAVVQAIGQALAVGIMQGVQQMANNIAQHPEVYGVHFIVAEDQEVLEDVSRVHFMRSKRLNSATGFNSDFGIFCSHFTGQRFKEFFRFDKDVVPALRTLLGVPDVFNSGPVQRSVQQSDILFCMLMYRLTSASAWRNVGQMFRMSPTSAGGLVNAFATFLVEGWGHLLTDSLEAPNVLTYERQGIFAAAAVTSKDTQTSWTGVNCLHTSTLRCTGNTSSPGCATRAPIPAM
jgi:hypothetical protein